LKKVWVQHDQFLFRVDPALFRSLLASSQGSLKKKGVRCCEGKNRAIKTDGVGSEIVKQ
jgi:hypothetical protein